MARIANKPLAELCNRWAVSEAAGIDLRRNWQREADSAPRKHREAFERIRDAVAAGDAVSDGVAASGRFFPPLFVALVAVGEKTGKLPDVLKRLAAHYEHRVKLRREFIAKITWPVMQLVAAVVIIGFLIWVLGFIGTLTGSKPLDVLGLGLVGNRGLMIYVACVTGVVACGYALYRLLRSDLVWSGGLQKVLLRIPVLGKALETTAISRFAWSLALALEAGMEINQAVRLALDASQSVVFRELTDEVIAQIAAGSDLTMALSATGKFSTEFIAAIEVGEHTGKLPESLLRQSEQYEQKAQTATAALTAIAGFAVWALVATMIVAMVFQIFTQAYLKPINDSLRELR